MHVKCLFGEHLWCLMGYPYLNLPWSPYGGLLKQGVCLHGRYKPKHRSNFIFWCESWGLIENSCKGHACVVNNLKFIECPYKWLALWASWNLWSAHVKCLLGGRLWCLVCVHKEVLCNSTLEALWSAFKQRICLQGGIDFSTGTTI